VSKASPPIVRPTDPNAIILSTTGHPGPGVITRTYESAFNGPNQRVVWHTDNDSVATDHYLIINGNIVAEKIGAPSPVSFTADFTGATTVETCSGAQDALSTGVYACKSTAVTNAIDPATLTWQVILDARSITGVVEGGNITTWPDTSGNGRNANGLGPFPKYRGTGSVNGQPLADFFGVANAQLQGSLPSVAIDVSAGFTHMCYVVEDVIDATDGGGFNAQLLGGSDQANGWRLWGVLYQTPTVPTPAWSQGSTIYGSGAATTGIHIVTAVVQPPGSAATVDLYYDGVHVASGTMGTLGPNTQYEISGNGPAQNVTIKGKVAWFGFTNFALSTLQRQGVEQFLRNTWG
jgi:hypothetical protein